MWEREKALLCHSTFWLGLCTIILNLSPYLYDELKDYPQAMSAIRIVTAVAWMVYAYLKGYLPEPKPPVEPNAKE